MAAPEVSPGLHSLLASLDPAARAALTAALQQGRLTQPELAQAWQQSRGSAPHLSRWLAGRLGAAGGTAPDAPSGAGPVDVTLVDTASSATRPAAASAGPAADRFGPYLIERELARGGMGVVHVARHVQLGRRVALKVLPAGAHAEGAERFQLEAQAAARLKHPNIVGVHEVGLQGEQPWLAMDLIEGESLQARLGRGPLPAEEAATLVEEVARAVAYAHKAGVLHRDIKPHNVLLDADGRPFLADFGLAKDVSQEAKGVTVSGQVLGTPAYMPPEQAAGELELVDRRADVYSLGATLYAALTGRAPFDGPTAINVITKVLTTEPPRPSSLRPGLDRDLETVCLRAMERDAAARYPTAHALAEDLRRWREGAPITARPVGALERLWRRARRNRALTGGLAALAAVAVAVWVGVTVQLDRSRDDALRAMAQEKQAKEAAEAAMAEEQRARADARLANARLAVLRQLDRGAMLLSLGRHVDARDVFVEAEGAAAALTDEAARESLRGAARRAREEADLHLGRRVSSDGEGRGHGCAFGPSGRKLATVEGEDVVVRDLDAGGEVLLRVRLGACQTASLAFTPDGASLVVAALTGAERSTELGLDVVDRRERWRHVDVPRRVGGVVVDPTSELAAIFDMEGVTTLLDPRSGREVRPALRGETRRGCEGNGAHAYAAAFAPAEVGSLLAVGYSDGMISYWDVSAGQVEQRERAQHNARAAVRALAWPRPGGLLPGKLVLVIGDAQGKLTLLDLQAKSRAELVAGVLLEGEAGAVRSTAVGGVASDPLLAATTQDGSLWVWDGALRLRRRIHTADTDATSCAVSPDGRVLVTAGPRHAWRWDLRVGHFAGGGPVAFSADGRRLVLCRSRRGPERRKVVTVGGEAFEVDDLGYDVTAHDLRDGTTRTVELPNGYGVLQLLAVGVTPDGRVLVATSEKHEKFERHRLWCWDPSTSAPPTELETAQPCSSLAATPGGDGLLLGRSYPPDARQAPPTHVELRSWPGGQVQAEYAWHLRSVCGLLALDDERFVSASHDGTVAWWRRDAPRPERIMSARTGEALSWAAPAARPPLGHVDVQDLVSGLDYSPEQDLLAVAFGDGTVRLWRPGAAPRVLQGHEYPLVLCGFPTFARGELLVTASREGKARLWDVEQGTVLRTIETPGERLQWAALSPDGRRVALASSDEVWLHDLAESD